MDYAVAVRQIIEAERQAQCKAADTKERIRRLLNEDLSAEQAQMERAYAARVAVRLEKLRAFEQGASTEHEAQAEAAHNRAMAALESHYAAQKEAWVCRLYAYVTGGEAGKQT